jgi:molecular chaperone DnaK
VLRVAVDFGTSSTCAAVSVDAQPPQVVVVDGSPLLPSAVYATGDGTLFVGHEADRQAAVDPSRYEPHPKRRIDEPELLLGDTVLPVVGVVRAVLRRMLHEARHLADGAPVDRLVLTHPADWGGTRTEKLRRCAAGLAADIVLVPEPVAAAVFHSGGHSIGEGGSLAVLDLGGGTVDASVVRRVGRGFQVLGTRGDPNFGGADIDQALLEHVGTQVSGTDPDAWRALVEGRELADRRRRRVLRQDIRGAKETLSRHTFADVPMPPPFPDAHVTRADLEALIGAPMNRTVTLAMDTIADAGLHPRQLGGIFLVGGSSRIPLVSRLLHERLGLVPVTLDQPETVVARGALLAVSAEPDHPAPYQRTPAPARPVTGLPGRPGGPGHLGGSAGARPVGGPPGVGPVGAAPGSVSVAQGPPTPPPGLPRPFFPTGRQPPPPRRSRRWWLVGAGVALAAAIAVTAVVLNSGDDPAAPVTEIAQYHYRFAVPDGWERSGGTQAIRQVELGPVDSTVSPDHIYVKETELSYDADADRDRAVGELRTAYDDQRASGQSAFEGFDDSASFAGRDVLHYAETVEAGIVEWYVLFGGRYQVSVGCQHDDVGVERVRAACERVVRSLSVQK